jgi:penicillin-binding protein 1C
VRKLAQRRWFWLVASAAAFVVAAMLVLGMAAASLQPLDMTAANERSTIVLDRNDRLLRAYTTPDGRWRLPLSVADVDERYIRLLLGYEDRRFHQHPGVDGLALVRAAGQMAMQRRIVSGGSTISMQVARLIEGREKRSLWAKLNQALRAVEIERVFGKQGVLDQYLALAPFGGNMEGVRAASLSYFGKEPRRLSLGEAALLVAIPQSPEARRPDRFPENARRARDRVLDRAAEARLFPASEIERARGEGVPTERRSFPMLAPQVTDAVVAEKQQPVHRLSLDAGWQRLLEDVARERAVSLGPKVSAAIVVVENATGAIRASVGGADYLSGPRAGALDLTRALRSPGSALKPFVYALAFEEGIAHPETLMEDRPSRFGVYAPENFDLSFQGTVTARRALQMSLNVPAVDLLSSVGPQRFLARLRGTGAEIVLPRDSVPGLSLALGGLGITLQDLARVYATLARGGTAVPLTVQRVAGGTGSEGARLLDPVAAWYVADILRGATPPPNAGSGKLAFKTGTSYGYRDAWAVGYDRRHTVAVWIGRADGSPVPGILGRLTAAPVLFDAFARIGLDPEPFAMPANAIVSSNRNLPAPLRALRPDPTRAAGIVAGNSGTNADQRLRIQFPPEGASLEVARTAPGDMQGVPLKAQGGATPLIWLVDGKPVGEPSARRITEWTPDGTGFVRISVIDAKGETDSVQVRVR